MTSEAYRLEKPELQTQGKKEVAIIGAGIAGLTCALRLSERGFTANAV